MIKRIWGKILRNRPNKWQEIEYFSSEWKERILSMAQFIKPNEHVIDLGCGQMWLKEYLPPGCQYTAVDYTARDAETIICDFNAYQFPEIEADVAFVSGCLEYVEDYEWFVKQISSRYKKCIISYCIVENFPNVSERIGKAWVNHLSQKDIVNLFEKYHLHLEHHLTTLNNIFVFCART